jgi:two-component system response regulator RegA
LLARVDGPPTAEALRLDAPGRATPSLAAMEWEYLNKTLWEHAGCVSSTARALNIPRQTLYRKLRRYPPAW